MPRNLGVMSLVSLSLIMSLALVSTITLPPIMAVHPATTVSTVAYVNSCAPDPDLFGCTTTDFSQTRVTNTLAPDTQIGTATGGTVVADDPQIKYRDVNDNTVWILGPGPTGGGDATSTECVFRDVNDNSVPDAGENLGGTCPGTGGTIRDDPKIKFLDSNANGVRDVSTEKVFYDFNDNNLDETGTIIFSTDIIMYNIVDVESWQVKVSYDKTKLLVRSFTLPSPGFWTSAGGSGFPSIENDVGEALFGFTLLGGGSLTDPGPQLMVTINWRVANEGASNIHLVTDVEDELFGIKIKDSLETSELYDTEDGYVSSVGTVAALPNPEFGLTPPNPVTAGATVNFDASASTNVDTFDWDFGDGTTSSGATVSHPYPDACNAFLRPRPVDSNGCYRAVLVGKTTAGFSANATKIIIAQSLSNQPPVLQPIGDKTVDELTDLRFTAQASDPDGDPVSFSLGPGAPAGASIEDPTLGLFTWQPTEAQGPGTYPVTIVVSDSIDTDSETIQITVNEVNSAPVLSVPSSTQFVKVSDTLTFTATAQDPDIPQNTVTLSASGLAANMIFDPATGVFSFAPDSSQNTQTFTVTFTASDNASPSLSDSRTVNVIVDQSPLAAFTADKTIVARQEAISFDATTSIDPDGTIASYAWDFGDGATATGSTTSHSYTALGGFTVVLTVTDNLGAAGTHSTVITVVNRAPVIGLTADKSVAASGESVTLSITASDPDGTVQTTKIDWGDGSSPETFTGPISTATHTYAASGARTINVTVTDNDGTSTSRLQSLTISDPPTLSLMPNVSSAQTGTAIALAINSSDPDGTVETTRIDWGDGTTPETFTGATSIATHTYSNAGTYTITVTVTDDNGISTTKTTSITINPAFPLPGGPLPWIVVTVLAAVSVVFVLMRRRKARPAGQRTSAKANTP